MNIVWLSKSDFTGGLLSMTKHYCRRAGIEPSRITFKCLTNRAMIRKAKTKNKYIPDPAKAANFHRNLSDLNPKFIIIQDKAALGYITGKYTSLALTRGGIYTWTNPANNKKIPCLVVDESVKTKTIKHGAWVFLQDLKKLNRWLNGRQRFEPRFDYKVCQTVADVQEFARFAEGSVAIGIDIETTGTTITCIGYSCWHHDNVLRTFVVPFFTTQKPSGCFWETPQIEIQTWELIRSVHANEAVKIMQGGDYDATYFLVYRCPLSNYFVDTLHLCHSIWREAPKRLDFISSICLDYYTYWKDEKGENDKDDKKGISVPKTAEGIEGYWLYNALDCHNTLLSSRYLVSLINHVNLRWALVNYRDEFHLQFGAGLAMSMRGVHVNRRIQKDIQLDLLNKHESALCDLKIMTDNPDHNPNAPQQNANIIYDVLKATPMPRKGHTTDEKILKFIKLQHPVLDIFIETLWTCKKSLNNATKYGAMPLLNGRFMYRLKVTTETERFASSGHNLWIGQNVQNMPKDMRVMMQADDGYVLFDIDYSQSDAYFTAFTSEDLKYIETMINDKDVHSIHAAHFFKKDYDSIFKAHCNHEEWTEHPIRGVRQNTKRITYGANYLMAAYTLYVTMGREPVVSAAQALGYADADGWSQNQLVILCQKFLDAYHQLYPRILLTLQEDIDAAVKLGNRTSAAFENTRIFFGDLKNDAKIQREFAAFHGQGGTAGNINKAIRNIYSSGIEKEGAMLLLQVHDSLVGQVRKERLDLVPELQKLMENECEIKGRKFTVPTEASVGIGWGKRMLDWYDGINISAIEAHDRKWWTKWEADHTGERNYA